MRYPNAQAGIAKFFKGEILSLTSSVCIILAAIFTYTSLAYTSGEGSLLSINAGIGVLLVVIFTLASFVLTIVGYIFRVIGLHKAGKDHPNFTIAFAVQIFVLIITAVGIVLTLANVGNGIADNITNSFSSIAEIMVVVFVMTGCLSLVSDLGENAVFNKGYTTMIIICIVYGISAILILIPLFFGASVAVGVIELILALASGVLSIIGYIMFLVFLAKTKKALTEEK